MPLGNIIGIDPGSTNLGIGIITIDLETLKIIATDAFTIHGDKSRHYRNISEVHPARIQRIKAIEEELYDVLYFYRPFIISSESPFFGRFAQAFMVLVEVIGAIRNALWRYDQNKELFLIDPPTVKKALGATSAAKKESVAEALSKLKALNLQKPIETLDEHSVDAVGVAYGAYKNFLERYHSP